MRKLRQFHAKGFDLLGIQAALVFLASAVDLHQNVHDKIMLCRLLFDLGGKRKTIHGVDHRHLIDDILDLVTLQGADKVMSALISDEIQVGLMGPEASVYVANQEREDYAINFAQLTQRDGSFLVGREPVENFSLEQLGAMERAEIIGGRAGGMPEMTLEYVLKTNGLDIGVDDESKTVNVPINGKKYLENRVLKDKEFSFTL